MSEDDQRFYNEVAEELARNFVKPGLWARAIATVGDEGPKARAAYIRLRVLELKGSYSQNVSEAEIEVPSPSTAKRVRVRGWMLAFCLVSTVVGPAIGLLSFFGIYSDFSPHFAQYPKASSYFLFLFLYVIPIVCYQMIVGIIVWTGRKSGLRIARNYLGIRLIYSLSICILIWFLFPELNGVGRFPSYYRMIGSEIVTFAFWWTVFARSQHVRKTYGEGVLR